MSAGAKSEREKRVAARAAAEIVESGMTVGLGTGSTVAYLLPALAARRIAVRYVTSSPATEHAARDLGIEVESFNGPAAPTRVDVTIDSADQVSPAGWLVTGAAPRIPAKGSCRGGRAVRRDRLFEQARPAVIAADPARAARVRLAARLARLGHVRLRGVPRSPDGGVIADYLGEVDEPDATAARLSSMTGVIEHGLLAPTLVSEILGGSRRTRRPDHDAVTHPVAAFAGIHSRHKALRRWARPRRCAIGRSRSDQHVIPRVNRAIVGDC